MAKPLEGIRVFDLTLAMVGPWATSQLGALGADVIHVEAPVESGVRRAGVPPSIKGTSIGYINWNLNKRAMELDLKNPRDRQIGYRLLETCDVFVENMRPGAVDRLGMSYDEVAAINPRIIYISSSGWGASGPMAGVPAADPMVQVFCGWASVTGAAGGEWEVYRHFTQNDANTSNYIVQSVLLGLLARDRTAKGQRIDLSMLGGMLALQTSRIAEFFATGRTPPPMGSANTTTVPQQAFLCEDQRSLAVGVEKEEQWPSLCRVLQLETLIDDPRFRRNRERVANREELIPILERAFRSKPRYHWVMELNEAGVPAAKFMDWDEIRFHPQNLENQHIVQVPTPHWGPMYSGGPPYHFGDAETEMFSAPLPGEHNAEILRELGIDDANVEAQPEAPENAHPLARSRRSEPEAAR